MWLKTPEGAYINLAMAAQITPLSPEIYKIAMASGATFQATDKTGGIDKMLGASLVDAPQLRPIAASPQKKKQ